MDNNILLTDEQIKSVKGKGFLHNRGTRNFSARIITENGVLNAEQMEVVAAAAKKYGNGNIALTVRLTLEVPGVSFENIEPFREYVGKAGIQTGGTGSKVRPIVACKGTTCVFGLSDTQKIAKEIHKRFFEGYSNVILPHKFKIAIGGCPNNCIKPDLNDIGIVSGRVPNFNIEACKGCKICKVAEKCPMDAIKLENGKIVIDENICNCCGMCMGKCTFKIELESETIYKVYIGGKWGKKVRMGTLLNKRFTKEEALDVVEKSILLFKSMGEKGERFGDTIDRIGIKKAEEILISDDIMMKKDNILNIQTEPGSKC